MQPFHRMTQSFFELIVYRWSNITFYENYNNFQDLKKLHYKYFKEKFCN